MLNFKQPTTFNRFMACVNISRCQRVKAFKPDTFVNGAWMPLKDELADWDDGLETIGRKRIICFPYVTVTHLRLNIIVCLASMQKV